MKNLYRTAAFATAGALFALPALASAQVYYYAPNTTSGVYNYDSYIPSSAMPYVELGYEEQEQSQEQYESSYNPSSYDYESPYETSYPSEEYGYSYPSSEYSYGGESEYGSDYENQYGEYGSEPQSISYPSGTTGPFGTELCYWSDYPTYAPCSSDPQQWIQDPYTGGWY